MGGGGDVSRFLFVEMLRRYYFALGAERAKRSDRCMLQLEEDREPSSSVGGVVSYTDGTRRCRSDFIRTRGGWRTELWAPPSWRVTWQYATEETSATTSRSISRRTSLVNKRWRRSFELSCKLYPRIDQRERVGGEETGRLNNFQGEEHRQTERLTLMMKDRLIFVWLL